MSRIVSLILTLVAADILGLLAGALAAVVMTEAAGVPEAHALALGRLTHFVAGVLIFLAAWTCEQPAHGSHRIAPNAR